MGITILVFSFLLLSQPQAGISDLQKEEQALFEKRGNPEDLNALIDVYQKILSLEPRNEQYWIKLSYAYYFAGYFVEKERKKRIELLSKCMETANKAKELDPDSLEGNYWHVTCHGELTIVRGVLLGGFKIGESLKGLNVVAAKNIKYHYGGTYRFWGRFIWALPWLIRKVADIDLGDSVYFYNKAIEINPDYIEPYFYMAESYLRMGRFKDARKKLEWIMNFPIEKAPEFAPENIIYKNWAEELYKKEFTKAGRDENEL